MQKPLIHCRVTALSVKRVILLILTGITTVGPDNLFLASMSVSTPNATPWHSSEGMLFFAIFELNSRFLAMKKLTSPDEFLMYNTTQYALFEASVNEINSYESSLLPKDRGIFIVGV